VSEVQEIRPAAHVRRVTTCTTARPALGRAEAEPFVRDWLEFLRPRWRPSTKRLRR
jgi:hypothetical protein